MLDVGRHEFVTLLGEVAARGARATRGQACDDRIPGCVVRLKPDVIVTNSSSAPRVKQATSVIPINLGEICARDSCSI
jgi:hypothetical protein